MLRHGSVFSGVGGFDLAAESIGWNNIFHCEIKDYSRSILVEKYPESKSHIDITTTDFKQYKGKIDILTGGFPCQDISYAKSWTTNDTFSINGIKGKRSGLWWEQLRAFKETGATWMVAENVKALTRQGLDIVLQSLAEIGYYAEWQVIPGFAVGAPHLRERVWIVAYPKRIGRKQESIIFSKITSETLQKASKWEFSRTICPSNGKKTLPKHFGIHDGLSRGLYDAQRIEAMGNAIVPDIAVAIFQQIEKIHLSLNL